MKNSLYIIAALLILSSCSSKKLFKAAKADKDMLGLISNLQHSPLNYIWLREKTNFSYSGNGQDFSAAANIKFRKDSLIWGSVSLFIELARLQVTRDSAVLLNRTQKEYTSLAIKDLQNVLAIPGLNIDALQRLFLAYPPFDITTAYTFEKREIDYKLVNTTPLYREEIILDAGTLRMKEYTLKKNESQKIRITYDNFEKVETQILPKKINFEVELGNKTQILFDVTGYTLESNDEAPFSIPSSYRKH